MQLKCVFTVNSYVLNHKQYVVLIGLYIEINVMDEGDFARFEFLSAVEHTWNLIMVGHTFQPISRMV